MRRMQAIFTNDSAEEDRDLVVFAQSSRLTQPGTGSLRNPVLDPPAWSSRTGSAPINQTAHVAAIGKDSLQALKVHE